MRDLRMHMLMEMILLVVGFAMLIKGADIFVEGAAGIAAKFGIFFHFSYFFEENLCFMK